MEDPIFRITNKLLLLFLIFSFILIGILTGLSFIFDYSDSIDVNGSIIPENGHLIKAPCTGIIKNIYVQDNSTIKSGEYLADLVQTEFLDELKIIIRNQKRIENLISTSAIQEDEAVFNDLLNAFTENQRILSRIELNTEPLRITSPSDGNIIFADILNNQDSGIFVQKNTPLFMVGDLSRFHVQIDIPDRFMNTIKPGNEVKVFVNALPYLEYSSYSGEIISISEFPALSNSSGAIYTGLVEINDNQFIMVREQNLIKPGMSVKVKIIVSKGKVFRHLMQNLNKKVNMKKIRIMV
ncbi:MAG TPA: HlyD family efflux transporter periplasmic adaptor subunit [Firmicutes bacterium]|nr:HlyD family efflux transporter periplasmic adaptor subunit [Bacillota bacterium]